MPIITTKAFIIEDSCFIWIFCNLCSIQDSLSCKDQDSSRHHYG